MRRMVGGMSEEVGGVGDDLNGRARRVVGWAGVRPRPTGVPKSEKSEPIERSAPAQPGVAKRGAAPSCPGSGRPGDDTDPLWKRD